MKQQTDLCEVCGFKKTNPLHYKKILLSYHRYKKSHSQEEENEYKEMYKNAISFLAEKKLYVEYLQSLDKESHSQKKLVCVRKGCGKERTPDKLLCNECQSKINDIAYSQNNSNFAKERSSNVRTQEEVKDRNVLSKGNPPSSVSFKTTRDICVEHVDGEIECITESDKEWVSREDYEKEIDLFRTAFSVEQDLRIKADNVIKRLRSIMEREGILLDDREIGDGCR